MVFPSLVLVFCEIENINRYFTEGKMLFNATIVEGILDKSQHDDIKRIITKEVPSCEFCPADEEILKKIRKDELDV